MSTTSEIASLQSTLFTTQRDLDQCLEASKSLQAREWQLQARIDELERENAALREALKPFAHAADGLSKRDYDARVVAWIGDAEPNNGGAYGLHASDFRRARAALAGEA